MSWSTSRSGSKQEVKDYVIADLTSAAKMYSGTQEADDVDYAKACIVGFLERTEMEAVKVSAYGSHSTSDGKPTALSLHVTIERAT